jgi:hypothetical protein
MAVATLQKEKDTAKKDTAAVTLKDIDKQMRADEPEINSLQEPLPMVVSPPSAPNLTSHLTGHVGQEVGTQAANDNTAMDMDINTQDDEQVDDNVKSPKKRNQKKLSPQKRINRRSMTVAARP